MHDARLGESSKRGVFEVLLEPLEGFVAAHTAQIQLERHLTPRCRYSDGRQTLRLLYGAAKKLST